MGVYLPTEDELEAQGGGDFALMPEDLYIVEVIQRTDKNGLTTPDTVDQPNPYNKTEAFPNGEPRPVLNVVMKAISFATGEPLVDENGDEPKGDVLFFAFLDTTKVGLKPRPSNFRKFITAANGLKPEASMAIESWSELLGKRLIVKVVHNKGKHKLDDYSPIRTRRRASSKDAAPAAEEAATNDEAMAKKAEEVFGEDAPNF